jgi:peptide/nickel transport system substrate-binding protein
MFGSKTRRLVGLALVLVMSLTFVVGVAQAQEPATLVIGWEQEPPLLAPRSDMAFAQMMTEFYGRGVWNWDTERNIYPIMVEAIPSPENGMVITNDAGNTVVTYKLREGMLWSDGEPITADDCMFWHDIMMDPAKGTFQRGSYPDVVESVTKVDDLTVVLTYNAPFPDYESQNTLTCGYPEHILGPVLEAEGTIDNAPYFLGQGAVGYGPYVLSEWQVGSSMTFDVNPLWDGEAPAFGRVILRFILDSAQMQNSLEAGEIDVAFNFSDDLVEGYQAIAGSDVFSTPGVFGDAIWMNVGNGGHPALGDDRVRRAIIHAIDRAALAEELVGPGTAVPKSWYAQQFWPEDLPLDGYDVDLANQLLTEAGWVDADENPATPRVASGVEGVSDGFPLVLRFYTTTRQIRMDYQTFIQEYLNEVGVQTLLTPVPANLLFADFLENGILDTGDFDLAIFALSAGALSPFADAPDWFGCDGIPTAEAPNGNNGWGWCDAEWDALDLQVGTTVDPVARLELAQEAIRHFYAGGHWHGLYLRNTWYAVNSAVVNPETAYDVGTLSSNYFHRIEYWQPAG